MGLRLYEGLKVQNDNIKADIAFALFYYGGCNIQVVCFYK